MKAILHIGTEKTGTTSTQEFFHKNRDALLNQRVLYPNNLGGVSHRKIASYGLELETADEFMQSAGLTDQAKVEAFHQSTESTLAQQLDANTDAELCVFSSEHLHSRLKTASQISKVKALLDEKFDSIEVHIHLRPQVDVAISLASTQSRVGGRVGKGFFNSVRADTTYYNYDLLVSVWEDVFGPENVKCIAFNKSPDYLSWLSNSAGIDLSKLPKPARINEALDVQVMALVNALVDSGSHQRIDFRVLDQLAVNEKLTLDKKMARKIQHRFEESNRTLIARRDDLESGQLQPNWEKFPEVGTFEQLEMKCDFGRALADLLEIYNRELSSRN